ncbi:1-deoxy-D-xylulose-5-phosphate reductoisomerase [Alkalimonas sp. MEB108]|uniref:1-deoxy-D-xylulose 5-phosphate reductoisomerase n=1 Tax=Alkalimonas cellulosilytica TaxID=3058395 RepID=A0ABU7J5A7_9GAMM|nr:1-deoxy-D-xylulose-5-phosphate reductoisomerase [Alkalimonas sp. MEB108]MEE2001689.1 1-deoxy-D-xylulose-5-phosphate reductoisomerase [Alkalimonas sp. MEB108]
MQQLVILGATGSIGQSTLKVAAEHPDRFAVLALTAHRSVHAMLQLCLRFQPRYAVMSEHAAARELQQQLQAAGSQTEVLAGEQALCDVAAHPEADMVMAAIVGAAGLLPTLAAVKAAKTVLLANKEALVMAGALFMQQVQQSGARLLPIDSEHNAIFQCLPASLQQAVCRHQLQTDSLQQQRISKIILTASGGPFLQTPLSDFAHITPAQAVAHPNWDMGQKISVDSATMMNKGLELIEAHWLFHCPVEQIEVVIHPQSVIHSMVQYQDGSVIAQLGQPDMCTPIAYAMAYPERISTQVAPLDFSTLSALSFSSAERSRFPNLYLAIDACRYGQAATTALNAANEVAVSAFLAGQLRFDQIALVNAAVLEQFAVATATELEAILELDQQARMVAEHFIQGPLA